MSKFNKTATIAPDTRNLAGGDAYSESPELELISILLTSFVQDQFYKSEGDTVSDLANLIKQVDGQFAAKAALYARNEFGMRSISHVAAGEIARNFRGQEWLKRFFDKIVKRPDDMTEIISYLLAKKSGRKKAIPNALKKGFAKAIERFDHYQLSKYRMEGKAVSLVDVVNMVHPQPVKRNAAALKMLVNGTLKSSDTWESKLSAAGDSKELKAAVWKDLVMEGKIGYFALLRNLRNIVEQAEPEVRTAALELLVDRERIEKSLVLPFRFTTALQAMAEISNPRDVIIAINTALEYSLDNVPKLPGKTLIALDCSASMNGRPIQIGALFASVLYKANNADVIQFSTDARMNNLNPADSIGTLTRTLIQSAQGGGTNFQAIFQTAKEKYERIIILSDMQAWEQSGYGYYSSDPKPAFNDYKKRTGTNPHIYSFDLQGYGSLQFPEKRVYALAGFSDKIFDIMGMLEQDRSALINTIKAVQL